MNKLGIPVPIFIGLNGQPIDNGTVYIGVAGQNPETNPISVYWDELMTTPAAQPIKVSNGYPMRNGSPANVYMNTYDYSLTVRDKKGRLVYSTLHTSGLFVTSQTIVFSQDTFGAVGDGVTDNTTALNNFLTYLATNGGNGYIPPGTYKISNLTVDFTGTNKPFRVFGASRDAVKFTSSTPTVNMLSLKNAIGVTLDSFSIVPGYTGTDMTGGAGLVLINCSYCTVKSLTLSQFKRVAIMSYNDHQDNAQFNPAKVYYGLVFDDIDIDGASAYSFGVGPSAFIVVDANNSRMTNCRIKNIGLYGYEFKNDSNNCWIIGCLAEDTYYPFYFGGDGFNFANGYVKNSLVADCIVRRGFSPVYTGNAWFNTFRNISVDNTGLATQAAIISFRDVTNQSSALGIDVKGRNYYLFDTRNNSSGNIIEFSNVTDGAYTGRASFGFGSSDCNNNTVVVRNRDSTQQLWLDTYSFYNNTVIDEKYNWRNVNIAGSAMLKTRIGSVGADAMFSATKGIAYVADTLDEVLITNQDHQYRYIGNLAKPDIYTQRYTMTTGTKRETLYAVTGGTSQTYVTDQIGYYPSADNTQKLGGISNRWSVVYAGTGAINTSDAREKQQVRELSDQERAVAIRLKSLVRMFKFNDAVKAKGDGARIHCGVIAQDVKAAFEAEGLRAEDYAILCYDEWEERQEIKDENGLVIQEYIAAGNRYGVRYEELLAFIISAI